MRQSAIACLVGWLILSEPLRGQSDWTAVQRLPPGTIVRVTAGSRQAVGAIAAADMNELSVRGRSTDMAHFARAEVDVVETFAGNPHPKRRGARNGALWSLILVVPATLAAEMGGMDHKYLPVAYCVIVCGGAALGAWLAEDAPTVVVYRK